MKKKIETQKETLDTFTEMIEKASIEEVKEWLREIEEVWNSLMQKPYLVVETLHGCKTFGNLTLRVFIWNDIPKVKPKRVIDLVASPLEKEEYSLRAKLRGQDFYPTYQFESLEELKLVMKDTYWILNHCLSG